MRIKERLSFIASIIPNLSTDTLEAAFKLNHDRGADPDSFEVTKHLGEENAKVMYKELSKRYVQEVREMGFRTIPH